MNPTTTQKWANLRTTTSQPGWDTYRAPVITDQQWDEAQRFAAEVAIPGIEPEPTPGLDGSIFFLWRDDAGQSIEVEMLSSDEEGWVWEAERTNGEPTAGATNIRAEMIRTIRELFG